MKANELRVGNLIEGYTQCYCQIVTGEHIKMADEFNDDFNLFYRTIPITKEWLLKFGFNVVRSEVWELYYIKINKYTDLVYADDFSCGVSETNTSTERGRVFPPYIKPTKYVHQLQNLYFSLTGKELKLKT